MKQFTWCAVVNNSKTLFGRIDALDVDDANLKLIKHLTMCDYHINRLSVNGFRSQEPLQMDVLP